MKTFLRNMTSGQPTSLIVPCAAAFVEGLCRIVPAAGVYVVFETIYTFFARPGSELDMRRLWTACAFLAAWLVVQYLASAFAYSRTYRTAYESSAAGRKSLADHLRRLGLGFLYSRDPGDLTTMMLSDYATVENSISHDIPQLAGAVVFPLVVFLGLLSVDWRMALAMYVSLPVSLLIVWLSTGLQLRLGKKQVEAKVDSAGRLQEYLSAMREIKAFNLGGAHFVRLREAFERLMKESIRGEGILGSVIMSAIALLRLGLTLMIFAGAFLLAGGELRLPVFLLFLLVGSRVFEPMTIALIQYARIRYAGLCAGRIMAIRAQAPLTGTGGLPDGHTIAFEKVTFGYGDVDVLKDVSFTIPPRTVTALVGPSGSGKSTVLRLIARFWDVRHGRVTLAGRDIRTIDQEKLLSQMAVVFQDVYLFQDSIRNNIRVGNQAASQEEIEQAAKQACCHDFIMKLPQGYETLVGERGCTLSGGERQRISIARALLKDAPIVLLDEATASLDPENERDVQRAISALVSDKSVLIIAHRLKTVIDADQILVLENGRLAECGRHAELLENEGLYARMWHLQRQSAGWSIDR